MLEKVIENWTSRLDNIRASSGSHMPEIIFKIFQLGRHVALNAGDARKFPGRGRNLPVTNQVNKEDDQVSQLKSWPRTAVQPRRCVAGHYRGEESRSFDWRT
ncbi:hypothetical protein TNCV_930601 [Trichonephila clavipes]|uniref:Uncharacterized protein n=1 Tax=Trichonephila clavipes TaxID=2585209 RepID=A0A8X6W2H6_TRICX|nr:hypothetical protein TNCV_930601 [Trichonephila clavipes]